MEKIKEELKYNIKGITLISLVVTIVVLLILAGISISTLVGENGIITKSREAKIMTALGAVKEEIELERNPNMTNNKNVTVEQLLADGKIKRTVKTEGDNYYMYYAIKPDVYQGMQGMGKGIPATLKDVFFIDDEFNVKYIDKNGKEYGDNIEEKILEDETDIRFSSKKFSEYISKISGVTEEKLKFKWMKNQTRLIITDPSVDSLDDLVFFPNLTSLALGTSSSNAPQITTLDGVENCVNLKSIDISYGPEKNYTALRYLPNLVTFYRYQGEDYENIIENLEFCNKLSNLSIVNCSLKDMKQLSKLKNVQQLTLYANRIEKIEGLENMLNLKKLSLTNNRIKKIEGLENNINIEEIYLLGNKITKIEGLESLTNLKKLDLEKNEIIDITPLKYNVQLTSLNLKRNPGIDGNISNYIGERLEALNKIGEILDRNGTISIDVDKIGLFTNYKKLDLSGQNLTTLESLEGLTELTELNIYSNNLTLEDEKSQNALKKLINLRKLDLRSNKITNVTAINSLKNLVDLNITGNENNINLAEMEDIISNLSDLRVSTESLKTIVNCNVNKITKLNIRGSGLTEIPDLSKFTQLTQLNLYNNPTIVDLSTISNITSLQTLNLSSTNLHGRMIDFSKLTNLKTLDLSDNTLWKEDLENLKALKGKTNLSINLSNNSIIDATALLELDSNTKINLKNNINLTQKSKDDLKARFGSNVTF